MQVLIFLAFLLVSHFLLMQVFRLTTYHAYFWKALPLLLAYSATVGGLLYSLKLHQFFLWQVGLASAWLFVVGRRQSKSAQAMLALAGNDAAAVRFMSASALRTSAFYLYSCVIYVVGLSIVYIWLYNT
jgi:hypothetical protein